MFLTQAEREARRAASAVRDTVRIVDKAPGRPVGAMEVSVGTKALVGTLANLEGQSNIELAKDFNLRPEQVSDFKQGKIGRKENAELKEAIDENLGKAKNAAEEILLSALGLIDEDRLRGIQKTKDLVSVAKDMSQIVRNVTPQQQQGPQNLIQIINHGQLTEEAYETIEIQS
jgi:hypothetical protein